MDKKIPHFDLSHLPEAAGQYIKSVIKKMRYRKKVRADVLAELASDFDAELKDCTNDQQKLKAAQQLIDEFGDEKMLAVLLRRAKKRCRPFWRTAIVRTLQISVVSFVVYIVWFITGRPVVSINYVAELNRMVRPIADESLNAAPLYTKAAKQFDKLNEDNGEIYALLGKKPADVNEGQKQSIGKWLSENTENLELVIAGSKKPYCWFTYKISDGNNDGDMIAMKLPQLNGFRSCAYALRWRALLKAEAGRFADAFDDIKACYRLGKHLRGDITLIEQLVGTSIKSYAMQTIRENIRIYKIDSKLLADFQNDFEQIIAGENFVFSLKAEKMCALDEIQRCFTSDKIGKGHIYLKHLFFIVPVGGMNDEPDFSPSLVGSLLFHPNKEQTLKSLNKLYDYWEQVFLKTPAKIHNEKIIIDNESQRIIKGNLFLEVIAPAFGKLSELSYQYKTDVEATLTILAITRYKQDKGRLPENLEQLISAGYLKQIPSDPFSDKPLVYKQKDGDFILYSYGINGTDEGGIPGQDDKGGFKLSAKDADIVFWPVQE
jgi:hypothetical protein